MSKADIEIPGLKQLGDSIGQLATHFGEGVAATGKIIADKATGHDSDEDERKANAALAGTLTAAGATITGVLTLGSASGHPGSASGHDSDDDSLDSNPNGPSREGSGNADEPLEPPADAPQFQPLDPGDPNPGISMTDLTVEEQAQVRQMMAVTGMSEEDALLAFALKGE